MTKAEAYEKYPSLRVLQVPDLVALLDGCIALGDDDFAEAITAVLKETKED